MTELIAKDEMNFFVEVVYFLIIFGILIWAVVQIKNFILWLKWFYKEVFIAFPQKMIDQKFIHRIYSIGAVIAYNEEANIIGVTSRRILHREVADEQKRLTEKAGNNPEKLAKPVRVMVNPTYTFARKEDGYMMVTGEPYSLESVIEMFIEKKTGFSRKQISDSAWSKARSILAVRDRRLVVPMVREGQLPNGEFLPSMAIQVAIWGIECKLDNFKEEIVRY